MKKVAVVILFLILLLVTGCNNYSVTISTPSNNEEETRKPGTALEYPVNIVDSLGRKITVEAEPEKIISLSPAITEILFAIGAGDKIIGVTDYCDYPPEALNKPKVGSFQNINIELIIKSQPDVVFVAAGIQKDFIAQLEDLEVKVVTLDAENINQVLENIKTAGRVTGTVTKSLEVVEDLHRRIAAVQEKVARADNRPKVFFEVWDDPLMTAGPGSFINDMIVMAGGENIAADAAKRYAEFSLEVLIERNPDIYIINNHAHEPKDIENRPGYQELKAVQSNQIYAIEDDLVTLPGPRIVKGLEEMAKIIHPELF